MEQQKVYTIAERTRVGINLYYDVEDGKFQFGREIIAGHGDTEIRMAIYWALNEETYIDDSDPENVKLLFAPAITMMIDEMKVKCRAHFAYGLLSTMSAYAIENLARLMYTQGDVDNEPSFKRRERMQQEAKRSEAATRAKFNAQHKPAPEGTVKELAAKYGKSLSEIRRLKAAGELHTLVSADGT